MKSFKTAVVIIPPFDVWEPIQELRRKHDRKIERWMPHVTLLYPFVPVEEFDAAAAKLIEACAPLSPFHITLASFRYFDHGRGRYTAWIGPEPTDPVVHLHAALVAAIPECDDTARGPVGFTPHLSVGQFRRRIRALEFVRKQRAIWKGPSFEVKEISLLRREDPPDDVFHPDRTVPLGG